MSQMNIAEFNNPHPSPKETVIDRKTLSSINSFKSTEGGNNNNNNNNNNTAINKKRINANFNKIYILLKSSK